VPRKTSKAPPPQREHFNLLPIVKAYPVVDPKYGEAVCVAALTTDVPRRWIRLFPLDFRNLNFSQQFGKYQHISVDAFRAKGDHRPDPQLPGALLAGAALSLIRSRFGFIHAQHVALAGTVELSAFLSRLAEGLNRGLPPERLARVLDGQN
jgi:hypothetical protein